MDFIQVQDLAEAGDLDSQFLLARLYGSGEIGEISGKVQPDLEQSFYWCHQAAKSGHLKAQANLGQMYNQGIGTESDNAQGYYWLSKAASVGYVNAQFVAGLMLLIGEGVKQDITGGLDWLYKAASEGNVQAQLTIGSTYFEGKLVDEDYDEAKYWLKQSAEAGEPNGQYNLGMLYMRLSNSQRSCAVKAYKWLFAAAENNADHSDYATQALSHLKDILSKEEIASAISEAKRYRS